MAPAKEYLRQIRQEQIEIHALTSACIRWELSASAPAIRYDIPRVQTSPKDRLSQAAWDYLELSATVKDRIKALSTRKTNTIYMVGNMREPIQRAVIELYYLALRKDGQLMRFEDVAKTLHYQTDSVKKIHGQALRGFYEANKEEIDTWIREQDIQK